MSAGFKTHILVSVGAAAFTLASAYGLEGTTLDPNLLRLLEDRVIYPLVGQLVGVRVQFRSPGYGPLSELMTRLEQAHVTVKEMALVPGENVTDTIHLRLRLPRGLTASRLTGLIADLSDVRSVAPH